MTAYSDTIDYLFCLQKLGIKLGLDRMKLLLKYIGNPQDKIKCIHVTGTNGKGSVCIMISSILTAAGYKVGLYMSPHLHDFTERISINGRQIEKVDVVKLVKILRPKAEKVATESEYGHPTFFEIVTAMAFKYFALKKVDIAVIEAGIGAEYDATNVIKPLVSVITNVALEHLDMLGDNIMAIASNKSKIIKENVVLVTAVKDPNALKVINRRCSEVMAEIIKVGDNIKHENLVLNNYFQEFEVKSSKAAYKITTKLLGYHQKDNASIAIGAAESLLKHGFVVTEKNIVNGLKRAELPGRFEIISKYPLILVDGAHNPSAAEVLKINIMDLFNYKKIIFVVGILSDKDIEGIARVLSTIADVVIATKPRTIRAADPVQVAYYFRQLGTDTYVVDDVKGAVLLSKKMANKNDLICITGSLYTVGEARSYLKNIKHVFGWAQ